MGKWTEVVKENIIFHSVTGSTLHGLNLEDSDRDEFAICLEPLNAFGGFSPFEHDIHRDAAIRTGDPDAPSQPGDLDLKIYSLKKYLKLACAGNPEMLDFLFVDTLGPSVLRTGAVWHCILDIRDSIVSKQAAARYLGYMKSQMMRLKGEKGQKGVNRPELVEKFGYDVDYARHIVKLGANGVELLSTGKISIPMQEDMRQFILAMRRGGIPLDDAFKVMQVLESELLKLRDTSPLRDEPDYQKVEEVMLDLYWERWKCHRHNKTYLHLVNNRLVEGESCHEITE